jgi:hypothetical protein
MQATAPIWLEYVKAFGTIGVAVVAACIAGGIAYRQWQTAHAKLVLDLFDRRFESYLALNTAIAGILSVGAGNADVGMKMEFFRAKERAKFLFGRAVNEHLQAVDRDIGSLLGLQFEVRMSEHSKIEAALDRQTEIMQRLGDFFVEIDSLVAPYMTMDQKHPR